MFFRWSIACKRFIRRGRTQKVHTPASHVRFLSLLAPKLSVFDVSLRKQRRSLHRSLQLLHPPNFPLETSQLGVYLGRAGWEVWFHSSEILRQRKKLNKVRRKQQQQQQQLQHKAKRKHSKPMPWLHWSMRPGMQLGWRFAWMDHDHLNNLTECLLMWWDAKDNAPKFFFSTRWGRGLALTPLKTLLTSLKFGIDSMPQLLQEADIMGMLGEAKATLSLGLVVKVGSLVFWRMRYLKHFVETLLVQADSELLDLVKQALIDSLIHG